MKNKDDVETVSRPSTRTKRLANLRATLTRHESYSMGMKRQMVLEIMQGWELNEHTQRDYMRTLGLR